MNTSDNEFPLAIGDRVRIISKSSQRFGQDGIVVELPDSAGALPYRVQLIDEPCSSDYPQNPSYYAREALCFLEAKKIPSSYVLSI